MGEVVNLRQARKRAARTAKDAEAEANRASFGRSAASKAKTRREAERAAASLDGHRRERPHDPAKGDAAD